MTARYGCCCDRCGYAYLARTFPHVGLCPTCFLGSLPADQRGKLLGHLEKTGQRI
jgi:hypothetical protein